MNAELHKEVGRLLGNISSLQFEKDVTHIRSQQVIVDEIKLFYAKVHEVIDEGLKQAYNMAIDDVYNLIEYAGVVNDILNIKKA